MCYGVKYCVECDTPALLPFSVVFLFEGEQKKTIFALRKDLYKKYED